MGKDVDAATEIYEVAQADMKAEVERIKQELEAAREESFALGVLKKIAYDNAHNEFLEYAVLNNIKQAKAYKNGGMTWKQFCDAIGKSVRRVDEVLGDIRPLTEKFSAVFADLSGIKFSKIRYLGRSISADSAEITENGIKINDDEIIPITPDHKDEIEAFIDSLKKSESEARKEQQDHAKAKDREIKALHKTMAEQEKVISSFTRKEPDGVTGAEKEQLKGLAELKGKFEMFSRSMDISVNGYLEEAPESVRTEYGSIIAYAMKVMEHLRDRAFEDLGVSIFPEGSLDGWQEPDWVSPEDILAAQEASETEE